MRDFGERVVDERTCRIWAVIESRWAKIEGAKTEGSKIERAKIEIPRHKRHAVRMRMSISVGSFEGTAEMAQAGNVDRPCLYQAFTGFRSAQAVAQ